MQGGSLKSAIFDLDGTLADTSRDLISAANFCLIGSNMGGPLDPVDDAGTAFGGGRAMLRLGYSRLGRSWTEKDVDENYLVFLDHYGKHIDNETVLYPGVATALKVLASTDVALGVCTNKPEVLAIELLRRLGILPMFRAVLGADSLTVRKPDPRHLFETIRRVGGHPNRSVLIGDTEIDRETARRAKVPCVLVTFGPEGRAVEAFAPEGLLDDYCVLPALFEKVIAGR